MSAVQQMMMAKGSVVSFTYATWNPADKDASITLSGGDLTAVGAGTGSVRSTIGKSTGKWYWELLVNSTGSQVAGIIPGSEALNTLPGYTMNGWGYSNAGQILNNATLIVSAASYTSTNTIGVALDMDTLTIKWYLNNSLIDTETIASGTYYAITGWNANMTANFGATAFTYSAPVGYNAGLYT